MAADSAGSVAIDLLIDGFFFLGILVSFRTTYASQNEDAHVAIPSLISKNYMKGWFTIDFLSTVPFDYMFRSLVSTTVQRRLKSAKLLKAFRLFRLFKLMRLAFVSQYIDQLEQMSGLPPTVFDIIILLGEVMFIAHIVACAWWGSTSFNASSN
jgi:hyperpolarization activated cyclic nucleotide-gated potassium channel 2